jgi:tRNA(fMet)-specific endonuclease VapC
VILLDTDHMTVLRFPESERCKHLRARITASGDEEIATTIVSAEEQIRGWLAVISRERTVRRQVIGYRELRDQLLRLVPWTLVPFDDAAADEFERLRRSGVRRLAAPDLKIASIALTRNALLLSANLRHFQQVPGLRVENWLD